VAGLAFKFGAVPFHMWVPDVYQGAPTIATLLIAAGPKLATFAMAFRILGDTLIWTAGDWSMMLTILSVLSLGVGNLFAIAQTNLKRMLAYSTISQVGFVLLGLIGAGVAAKAGNADAAINAFSSSLFYIVTYVLTTLATFGMIQFLAREGFEAEEIDDFKGLGKKSPWLAGVMLVMMFSLAGLPPLVGFWAKLAVLGAVVDAGMLWLAVYAVMMSLIGAFYYIRVVKAMFFDEPVDSLPVQVDGDARAVMALNGLAVIFVGLLPGPLVALCGSAIRHALQIA
jgi:NADH-quinone oxidoreductase subunit N